MNDIFGERHGRKEHEKTGAAGGGTVGKGHAWRANTGGGWPADEFTGEPGHFVRDPYTGVRSRATVAEVVTQVAGFDGVASAADVQ